MASTSDNPKEWLSLQEASERLGVSPATLRLWADQGRVHTFRTPGGHRRFRERDLVLLASNGETPSPGQSLRVLAHAALGRTRLEVTDGWLEKESWYRGFPPGAREEHRELGRRVVMSLSGLMSLAEPDAESESRAVELGRAYGQLNAKYGIALGDALRAFLFFRDAFIESLVELAKTSPTFDILTLMRRTSRFVDTMLLTMVELYPIAPLRKKKVG